MARSSCRLPCTTISARQKSPDSAARLSDQVRAAVPEGSPRRKHLIGVSGGRDSMALLHLLAVSGWKHLVVCHLDHGLRGAASRRDAEFVRAAADRLGFHCELGRVDTRAFACEHGLSLELAGRQLRHEFFHACARKHRCFRLLLAHHADDQVETILFNFLRGTGLPGLAGMKPVSSLGRLTLVRPFLNVPRREIDAFVRARRIAFREDRSNTSPAHTRNRIRHHLLPEIERTAVPAFRQALLRTAAILAEENALLESLTPEPTPELSCPALRQLPTALRRRMVLQWLRSRDITDAGFAEVERVLSLLDPVRGPAKINLPGDRHARRRQGKIFLE
jgi:tRNA(Ile)-lysidine synthase